MSWPSSLALTSISGTIASAPLNTDFTAIQSGFNDLLTSLSSGVYSSYTPTWAASGTAPAIGNGTVSAHYTELGKLVHAYGIITFGSTTTFGTGSYSFTPPVNAGGVVSGIIAGTAVLYNSSTAALVVALPSWINATKYALNYPATYLGTITATAQTAPWTWAAGHTIAWNMLFEGA